MARKQCTFCGEFALETAAMCPRCREAFPAVTMQGSLDPVQGKREIRRGILYVVLSGVVHYFTAGYSGMQLPLSIIIPAVDDFLLPFLALCGMGLIVLGFYRRFTR
ncbi:MAG TPA: hypothetical protein VGA40_05835 [Candidatus Acidoferrales bacterium]